MGEKLAVAGFPDETIVPTEKAGLVEISTKKPVAAGTEDHVKLGDVPRPVAKLVGVCSAAALAGAPGRTVRLSVKVCVMAPETAVILIGKTVVTATATPEIVQVTEVPGVAGFCEKLTVEPGGLPEAVRLTGFEKPKTDCTLRSTGAEPPPQVAGVRVDATIANVPTAFMVKFLSEISKK